MTSVALSVAPTSIAGRTCGSLASFTYTAIFHIPAHTAGGTIQFAHTLNNGRSQTTGTVTAGAGETSKALTFVSPGPLEASHTYPGTVIVVVTSPNHVISPSVKPSGACVEPGPFQVTAVSMTVNPTSIAGTSCGTFLTVTYTALFHLAPNGPGGTMQFEYTVNNGRSANMASITAVPGQTTASYSFLWSGNLPADHTYPEPGGIEVTSLNQLISPLLGPTGMCVAQAAFVVTRVDMTVSPTSIQGLTCGTSIVVTYTATIHVAANSPGGTVQFGYTVNNGRSQNTAKVTFAPGETSKTYSFTWSGALPADHTYPQPGGIEVTSPNQLISPMVGTGGTCK